MILAIGHAHLLNERTMRSDMIPTMWSSPAHETFEDRICDIQMPEVHVWNVDVMRSQEKPE